MQQLGGLAVILHVERVNNATVGWFGGDSACRTCK